MNAQRCVLVGMMVVTPVNAIMVRLVVALSYLVIPVIKKNLTARSCTEVRIYKTIVFPFADNDLIIGDNLFLLDCIKTSTCKNLPFIPASL